MNSYALPHKYLFLETEWFIEFRCAEAQVLFPRDGVVHALMTPMVLGWVLALIHFLALTHWNLGPGGRLGSKHPCGYGGHGTTMNFGLAADGNHVAVNFVAGEDGRAGLVELLVMP